MASLLAAAVIGVVRASDSDANTCTAGHMDEDLAAMLCEDQEWKGLKVAVPALAHRGVVDLDTLRILAEKEAGCPPRWWGCADGVEAMVDQKLVGDITGDALKRRLPALVAGLQQRKDDRRRREEEAKRKAEEEATRDEKLGALLGAHGLGGMVRSALRAHGVVSLPEFEALLQCEKVLLEGGWCEPSVDEIVHRQHLSIKASDHLKKQLPAMVAALKEEERQRKEAEERTRKEEERRKREEAEERRRKEEEDRAILAMNANSLLYNSHE